MTNSTATQSTDEPAPQDGQAGQPSVTRIRPRDWSGEHRTYNLLQEENWQSWQRDIKLTFAVCGLNPYVDGTLKCPDAQADHIGANNWKYNDQYTQKVIRDRLSEGCKYHTDNCETAYQMWENLKAIYQSCGTQTETQLMREMTELRAQDGDNIIEHLATLKRMWDRCTLIQGDNLTLTPKMFKNFLIYSLPQSWDDFTRQFSLDKADLSIHHMIGECHEEYRRRLKRGSIVSNGNESAYANSNSLINRIGKKNQGSKKQNASSTSQHCTHCGRNNHNVEDCYHSAKPKCQICKKLGHKDEECRFKKKGQKPKKGKDKMVANTTKNQTHIAQLETEEEETLASMETETLTEETFIEENDDYKMYLASLAANENARMYDWLADSGSTNHIANRRELFSSYERTPEATVHGVGGNITQVAGRGTIVLTAQYGTRKRTLRLENVNHIPSNKYNIFALGRWDSQGRKYKASNGELTLYNGRNDPVLKGHKISSNLYKFNIPPADA